MRNSRLKPEDRLIVDGKATGLFGRVLSYLTGLLNGERQVIQASNSVTDTTYGTIYLIDTTSGNLTLNLPNLERQDKTKWIAIKNVGANLLTINPFTTSQTIDGDTSAILAENVYVTLLNTKTDWKIVGA